MLERLEKLSLENKARFYREIIYTILRKKFSGLKEYTFENMQLSYEHVLEISKYAIIAYGNKMEKEKYISKFGLARVGINNELLEQIEKERLEYIYKFRQQFMFDKEALKEFASFMGINLQDIGNLSKQYAIDCLLISKEEYDWDTRKKAFHNSEKASDLKAKFSYKILFDLILMCNDAQEVIDIIEYSNVDMIRLRNNIEHYIEEYLKSKGKINDNGLKRTLEHKLNIYYKIKESEKQKKEIERKQNQIEKAEELIRTYAQGEIMLRTKEQITSFLGTSNVRLTHALEIVKESNPILYREYMMKHERDKELIESDLLEISKLLSYYALYGVEYNGSIRKFDLIDAFLLVGKHNIYDAFNRCARFMSKDEYMRVGELREEFRKLTRSFPSNMKFIENIEVGCKKDEKGFPIKGTGHKITKEDFENIKNYFDEQGLPHQLYKVALDRIKKGIPIDHVAISYTSQVQSKMRTLKK